jgi:hypothetical protein
MRIRISDRVDNNTIDYMNYIAGVLGISRGKVQDLFVHVVQNYFTEEQLRIESEVINFSDERTKE